MQQQGAAPEPHGRKKAAPDQSRAAIFLSQHIACLSHSFLAVLRLPTISPVLPTHQYCSGTDLLRLKQEP